MCEVEKLVAVEVKELQEKELRFDQCGDVPYYLPRINKNFKIYNANKKWDLPIITSQLRFINGEYQGYTEVNSKIGILALRKPPIQAFQVIIHSTLFNREKGESFAKILRK